MLALNRGEQNKILNVKREIPKNVESEFRTALLEKWMPSNASGAVYQFLLNGLKKNLKIRYVENNT